MLYVEKMNFLEAGIIYGCGNWGRQCIEYLEKLGIRVAACCDSNPKRWGKEFEGYPVLAPKEVMDNMKMGIIIAIEQSEGLLKRLLDRRGEAFLFRKIAEEKAVYRIKSKWTVLGRETKKELIEYINGREKIYLTGREKRREDFKYIFDWISIYEEADDIEDLNLCREDALYIDCDKRAGAVKSREDAIEIIDAEEIFCLLGAGEETDVYAVIWMLETFYAESEEQPPCVRPFTHAVIDSNFMLHFCCGDWSENIGSILGEKSLETLWQSDLARIFRLSMINRTYSFCNKNRCVHLKPNRVKKKTERLKSGMHTEPIPLSLEIGIDRTCNLYCKSCRNCVVTEQGERKEKIEKAKEIIMGADWTEKCNVLLLGGQGKVFASRPYQEIMLGFEGRRKSLSLRSNGVLLDEAWFQKLKEKYEALYIIISVDAARKETYQRLRRSHDALAWEKLQKNLQMLAEKRKTNELKLFQLNMCVQRDNYKEMADFVLNGEKLGVDKIYLTPIRNWGTYSEEEFEEISIFGEEKRLKKEVQEALDKVRSLSVKPVIEIAF